MTIQYHPQYVISDAEAHHLGHPQWQRKGRVLNCRKIDMSQQKVNPLTPKLTHNKIPIPPNQAVSETKVTQPNS